MEGGGGGGGGGGGSCANTRGLVPGLHSHTGVERIGSGKWGPQELQKRVSGIGRKELQKGLALQLLHPSAPGLPWLLEAVASLHGRPLLLPAFVDGVCARACARPGPVGCFCARWSCLSSCLFHLPAVSVHCRSASAAASSATAPFGARCETFTSAMWPGNT
jgi:hypothetical protein